MARLYINRLRKRVAMSLLTFTNRFNILIRLGVKAKVKSWFMFKPIV